MSVKIGLDFGTSNSGAAIYDGQRVRLLPVDPRNILPEVVKTIIYITRDQQCFIGQEALELYYRQNVNRMRRYVKKWAGEIDFVGAELHYVRDVYVYEDELKPGRLMQYLKSSLRKKTGVSGYDGTQVFGQYYRVCDLIQVYLKELKTRAESILGEQIDTVVVGRPVKFSDSREIDQQAEDTLCEAAQAAGFLNVGFELEPVAAALFYEKSLHSPENTLVFDFGGGTLDIAIMRLGDPVGRMIYSSAGIDIAGSDFDRAIIETRLMPHFGAEHASHQPEILELIHAIPDWVALPELSTPQNRQNLKHAIEQGLAPVQMKRLMDLIFDDLAFSFYNAVESAKISLSTAGSTVIALNQGNLDLWELYTRWQFEQDIHDHYVQIEKTLLAAIQASGLETGQIDAVVKTGGSSSIPLFTDLLEQIFGKERVRATDIFTSVAAGLAISAWER